MGPTAVRKAKEALSNLMYVLATEFLCATQALEFQNGGKKCGKGSEIAYKLIRSCVPVLTEDRPITPDIERIAHLISTHKLLVEVEKKVGKLA
jgi:histidine ammonia-lyase